MTLFESHYVQETIRERKRIFLQKFRMSSYQLCVTFRDKASADLELHTYIHKEYLYSAKEQKSHIAPRSQLQASPNEYVFSFC